MQVNLCEKVACRRCFLAQVFLVQVARTQL